MALRNVADVSAWNPLVLQVVVRYKDYAYYNIYNSYLPSLIWSPSGALLIWAQMTKEQRCNTMGWTIWGLGTALAIVEKTRIGTAVPALGVALLVIGIVVAGAHQAYCGG